LLSLNVVLRIHKKFVEFLKAHAVPDLDVHWMLRRIEIGKLLDIRD